MDSAFALLEGLDGLLPTPGDAVELHIDGGDTEHARVLRATGPRLALATTLRPERGDTVGLVWSMPTGRAWCNARVLLCSRGEALLELGDVNVTEHRRARRTQPQRAITAVVELPDGRPVEAAVFDVSLGGAGLLAAPGRILPGAVVAITFRADGAEPVRADGVVMHATPRGDHELVGVAIETGATGLLALALA